MIVEAIKPIFVSTPYLVIISVAIAIEALPDIGLKMASGKTSGGKLINAINGFISFTSASITPDVLKAPIAINKHNNVGNNSITVFAPSFGQYAVGIFLFALETSAQTGKQEELSEPVGRHAALPGSRAMLFFLCVSFLPAVFFGPGRSGRRCVQ